MKELYKKYRPRSLKTLIGQPEVVRTISGWVTGEKVPHAILLTGPSGCGKTTVARILKQSLNCSDHDFTESNVANETGIDGVRAINARMGLAPLGGAARVFLLDECHQLTTAAQNALLKMLEDAPAHVYFILATTDPTKLLKTVVSRCSELKLKPLTEAGGTELLKRVCEKESVTIGDEVLERIHLVAEGAPRKMLVILDAIIQLPTDEERLAAVERADFRSQGIALARLMFKSGASWSEFVTILKGLEEEPESVRRLILGYGNGILLGNSKFMHARAYFVIDVFSKDFYATGRPGLTAACYEVCTSK